jgi:DNA-directed RNA polymerase specialized sigma24 family protein
LVVLKDSLSNLSVPEIDTSGPLLQHEGSAKVRQRQKRLRPDEVARVIERYTAGATTYELAAEFGCHRNTISGALRKAGVRLRLDGLTTEQIEQAVGLYESGLSLQVVANRLGSTARTVHSRLLERGVAMRDTHGRSR